MQVSNSLTKVENYTNISGFLAARILFYKIVHYCVYFFFFISICNLLALTSVLVNYLDFSSYYADIIVNSLCSAVSHVFFMSRSIKASRLLRFLYAFLYIALSTVLISSSLYRTSILFGSSMLASQFMLFIQTSGLTYFTFVYTKALFATGNYILPIVSSFVYMMIYLNPYTSQTTYLYAIIIRSHGIFTITRDFIFPNKEKLSEIVIYFENLCLFIMYFLLSLFIYQYSLLAPFIYTHFCYVISLLTTIFTCSSYIIENYLSGYFLHNSTCVEESSSNSTYNKICASFFFQFSLFLITIFLLQNKISAWFVVRSVTMIPWENFRFQLALIDLAILFGIFMHNYFTKKLADNVSEFDCINLNFVYIAIFNLLMFSLNIVLPNLLFIMVADININTMILLFSIVTTITFVFNIMFCFEDVDIDDVGFSFKQNNADSCCEIKKFISFGSSFFNNTTAAGSKIISSFGSMLPSNHNTKI